VVFKTPIESIAYDEMVNNHITSPIVA